MRKVSEIWDKFTDKQKELTRLAVSGRSRVLAYGGSRSGKTFLICVLIVKRAAEHQGSRHLIARLRYSHARGSIWLDTLREAVAFWGLEAEWKESDHYVKIGDSEIWVDGLDDKERVEKILGREYATIFLNEVSQIAYPTVTTVLTRLAQKVTDSRNIAFFDCNPPSKFHWTYKMFIQGVDPESGEKLDPKHYGCLQMNPTDNTEHLPDGYIEDILQHLPENQQRRFLRGEFGDAQGVIFTGWEIVDDIPEEIINRGKHSVGLDFGFSVDPTAMVDIYLYGDEVFIDELLYTDGLTNQAIGALIKSTGITVPIYADSAEPKSIEELRRLHIDVRGAKKGPDSIRQGIDWLLSKKLRVTRRSVNVQAELQNYVWKTNRDGRELPEPIDDFNHAIDALRYGTQPFKRSPIEVSAVIKR
jgi:phage terminase large subunit